jgi:uncharacterized membrane protein
VKDIRSVRSAAGAVWPGTSAAPAQRTLTEAIMKRSVLSALMLLVSSPCFAQYSFTTVDYPGAAITRLIGFNDHFEAVGHYILPGQVRHAFKYSRGEFEPLDPAGVLGTHESAANQINNRGDITGWYTGAPGTRHGYVLINGVVNTIDYPGSTFTQVNGVSDTGIVFGHFRDASLVSHGFILQDGVFTQVDFPGALNTFPYYINTRGDVAGEYNNRAGEIGHGFVRTNDGAWIGFDAPDAPLNSTLAIGINDHREILGYYRQSNGQLRVFVVGLDDVFSAEGYEFITLPGTGATPETANNAGVFVGFYTDASGTHGLIAEPTERRPF